MLIAQISDLHLSFVADDPERVNTERLNRVLDALLALPRSPDLLLVTGDLVEIGDVDSYRHLRELLGRCPFPVHYALGNHDDRAAFADVFPESPGDGSVLHYPIDVGGLRLLVLDTLEVGRHGGGFCERRAAWLAARLAEDARPTLLVLHHPPIATGIGWMTTDPAEPWVRRLAATIEPFSQVIGMVCGHIHRAMTGVFGSVPVTVCPSVAHAVGIAFDPIDPERPDGRPMIVETPPGYALHFWEAGRLVTHFDQAGPSEPIVTYTAKMQPIVRRILSERPS